MSQTQTPETDTTTSPEQSPSSSPKTGPVRGPDGKFLSPNDPDVAPAKSADAPVDPEADIPNFGGGTAEGTYRHAERSDEGPRVVALEDTCPNGHTYLLVEPLGDPDMYDTYLVKPVDGNPSAFDVEYGGPNGTWARLLVESDLHVPDYVE